MKKSRGSDAAHGCSVSSTTDDNKKKLPFDNFGFFFGLSEHVMAKKASEEMKDFVPELKKLASRSRDYSFLQSDGAEIPKPSKGEHEEVGKSKSSSAKSESSSTKQCSTKPMPKQNKPVLKHSIKYRLKEERPEVVIGKAGPWQICLENQVKDRVKEEQSVDVSSVIQKIFGCNRKRPRDDDDGDDRAMVPTFDDILNEERKSAKIAKEEDERERLLLEKEEKQEEGLRATKKLKIKIKVLKN
ncbi:hypothetical protein C1H46_025237 [Malus baccata]|uniref:Uncharacterized protein n=1 Tax=Malus baccata TaxID=106549 RepID=A0A540LSD9_MALBA|nr:hypothetical protein C1H46_025237 [Malus baccata]